MPMTVLKYHVQKLMHVAIVAINLQEKKFTSNLKCCSCEY